MKNKKYSTVRIPNYNRKTLENDTKSILLAHKYMTTLFPGLVQALAIKHSWIRFI